MKPIANSGNRFHSDARRYAEYLETPEGRLRVDLTLSNVQEFLPPGSTDSSLHALDLGCGTGAAAIALARLGFEVTILDSSSSMLKLAERAMVDAGVRNKITVTCGDATQSAEMLPARSFDVVLCHNLLEYVDDPFAVLRCATRLLRDSSAILSVLVRNRAGEVLKAALQKGDLAAAEQNLDAEWGHESLYGGKARLFSPETLGGMMKDASLTVTASRGVRIVADYLPPSISRSAEYDRILALERELGKRAEFVGIARYLHLFAHPAPDRSGVAG